MWPPPDALGTRFAAFFMFYFNTSGDKSSTSYRVISFKVTKILFAYTVVLKNLNKENLEWLQNRVILGTENANRQNGELSGGKACLRMPIAAYVVYAAASCCWKYMFSKLNSSICGSKKSLVMIPMIPINHSNGTTNPILEEVWANHVSFVHIALKSDFERM
ncbi:hypothetical protein Trydic_g16315 [Trypoxylus dichotomus]